MRLLRVVLAALTLIASVFTAAVEAADVPPRGTKPHDTVRVGYLPLVSFAPLFIAVEHRYFEKYGVNVELIGFANAPPLLTALVSGDLDAGSGGAIAGFFNAIAKGGGIKTVADRGSVAEGYGYNHFLVRKDLTDQIRTYRDLKGKTILIPSPVSPSRYQLWRTLKAVGLDEKDVELRYAPFDAVPASFKAKQVDTAIAVTPHAELTVAEGLAEVLEHSNIKPLFRQQLATYVYSEKFMRDRPDAATRFLKAMLEGVRAYNRLPEVEVSRIISRFAPMKSSLPRGVKFAKPYLAPDMMPDVNSILDQQAYWVRLGFVQKEVPPQELFDFSFLRRAQASQPQ